MCVAEEQRSGSGPAAEARRDNGATEQSRYSLRRPETRDSAAGGEHRRAEE